MQDPDFDTLVPQRNDIARRRFVGTAVGSGFAAAAWPVMAQTLVKTDAQGLLVGEVTVPVAGFQMPAYRAAPIGRSSAPVVLVISEVFGVHEYIADVARRLGYEPRIALLAFSTFGHPAGERANKRHSALAENLKKWLTGKKSGE